MSEPVTSVQIEDVLSSVRRLLSSGADSGESQEAIESKDEKPPEKFVLTPALRVTEPDKMVESQPPERADAAAEIPQETTVVFDDDAPIALSVVDNTTDQTVDDVAEANQPVILDGGEIAEPVNGTSRDTLEATIAELEAAVVAQPDEWEPDGSEVKTVPTWETVSYPPLDDVEDAVAIEETSGAEMRAEGEPDTASEPDTILTSGPFIPEEAAYAPQTNDEDEQGADVIGLTFGQTQPIPEADEDEDYGDELATEADEDDVATEDDIDAYLLTDGETIDEEALRQLVMDIVREELQGKLGERITRNVRKMVRREIHRALDMHGFD